MNMDELNEMFGNNIEFSIKKRFGIIKLARENRANSLTLEMIENLKHALLYCQNTERIRGLILTGKGNTFTTGLDLDSIDPSDKDMVRKYENTAAEIIEIIFKGKPSICAINGRTMGDGVVYALSCDYSIAIEDSFFQMPEILSGIFPGAGTIPLMTKILGISWTKKILIFAEKIDSKRALEINMIDKIVNDRTSLMKVSLHKARFLSTKNQQVLNLIKLCANFLGDKRYEVAYNYEKKALNIWISSDKNQFDDFRKGIS
ncbi:MAG: hypothetical protein GF317_21230 [Candidatus Lokiarchaeota archaeon]|nr:hypothetical protein [Candidatus Lokiarchaeota archaeon]MBD3201981.1 hypothetical protein [Candidatus Lokiarchaeota archaeon]